MKRCNLLMFFPLITFFLLLLCAKPMDAQDSKNMQLLGAWPDGPCLTVESVSPEIVIFGDGGKVILADITTPSNPARLASLPLGAVVTDIEVKANHAFIMIEEQGLVILNVEDPNNPAVASTLHMAGYDGHILADPVRPYVYCVTNFDDLYCVDISNPLQPRITGQVKLPERPNNLALHGHLLYVAIGFTGVAIVDVTDPAAPALASHFPAGFGQDVAIRNKDLYVLAFDSLFVFDVTDPLLPEYTGAYRTSGSKTGMDIVGEFIYLVDIYGEVLILDVTLPLAPVEVSRTQVGGYLNDIRIVDGTAIVAHESDGMTLFDISDPAEIHLLGNFDTGGYAYGLCVKEGFVYLANGPDGLRILDFTDPASPSTLGTYDFPDQALALHLDGSIAYVAARNNDLRILDISDPTAIIEVSAYAMDGQSWDVLVDGTVAFVAQRYHGLQIIDISNPFIPAALGAIGNNDQTWAIDKSGDLAFLANGQAGLQIVDVSDPASPHEVGVFNLDIEKVYDVKVRGNFAYIADSYDGLEILYIHNPMQPEKVGRIDFPGYAKGVTLDGAFAYVAVANAGIYVADISDPYAPVEVGFFDTGGRAFDVFVENGKAYVADHACGVEVLFFDAATSVQGTTADPDFPEISIYPNPGIGPATLSISLDKAGEIMVRMLDIKGRAVEKICAGQFGAGDHQYMIPDPGTPGTYFLECHFENGITIEKFIRL